MAKRKVVLVGWDAADWRIINALMDRGDMPVMNKLVSSGVMGNLATLEPMLSPLLWTSIATGKRAYHHGILGFTDIDPVSGGVRPVTAASRRCRAVWNILAEEGFRSHVVGWIATHGERIADGSVVSNMFPVALGVPGRESPPAPRGAIWPERNAKALNELRVAPKEIDVGMVSMFVPRWQEVDQEADRRLAHLRIHLAECLSVQAAATWTLENEEWDFLAVYFRAMDEICHHFMPFHPPRMNGVPQREFELYRDVVHSAYRLYDLMLARLIALAGPEATVMVVSDHGFHSDHLRPRFVPRIPAGITVWHRRQGIFAAAGPDLLEDELMFGASLLDVTPTVLTLFGLPVGEDMEGKVLLQAFRKPPAIRWVPSWERDEDSGVKDLGVMDLTAEESQALLEQFVALGYIDRPSDDPDEPASSTERENRWSLARAYLDGGRLTDALILLEELHEDLPERVDFAQLLARCQLELGMHDEARQTIEATLDRFGNKAAAHLIRAEIAYRTEQHDESLEHLEQARAANPDDAPLWRQMALTLIKLCRWQEAEEAGRTALRIDPDDPVAWLALAHSQLRQGHNQQAVDSALTAVELKFDMPLAHFNLGWALLRVGNYQRAEQALQTALRLVPDLPQAHRCLAMCYRALGDRNKAQRHVDRRHEILDKSKQRAERIADLREQSIRRARERRQQRDERPHRTASLTGAADQQDTAANERLKFLIVSGLPRSGTSLMMQMLQAGGMDVLTDERRQADEHNAQGYFEWEGIRHLRRNPRIIEKADGRAVKVISALIPALPRQYRYKVLFVRRPVIEVAASQYRMRFKRDPRPGELEEHMVPILQKHLDATLEILKEARQIETLIVDYSVLVHSPEKLVDTICEFVGRSRLPRPGDMKSVVRPELHHYRQSGMDPVAGS